MAGRALARWDRPTLPTNFPASAYAGLMTEADAEAMSAPRTLAVVAVAAVVGGAAGTAGVVSSRDHGRSVTRAVAAATTVKELSARTIYRQASPSVVAITATGTADASASPFGFGLGDTTQTSTGTGFVVSETGLIVTNAHVIDGATKVTVALSNATTRTATVVGTDPSTDLALLRVDPGTTKLTPLTFADSGGVQIGDRAYAIGSPFGLQGTLTSGIVSATDRTIDAPSGATISNVLQTDAALNPGNSGGPLLDAEGHVIGVNSQIESASSGGGDAANTGVGFAIPSNTVKSVVAKLARS
jgi:putative serine protease PepD